MIAENLINGNTRSVQQGVEGALADGISAGEVLNGALVPGMDEVGRRFKANEFYVPEVLIAARAMRAGMDVLKPALAERDVPSAGQVVIGTLEGDLHDIGKNLVAMMLEGEKLTIFAGPSTPTTLRYGKVGWRQEHVIPGTNLGSHEARVGDITGMANCIS